MSMKSTRKVYSSILVDNYGSYVQELVSSKNDLQKLLTHISRYIDRNTDVLSYPAPTKRLQFNVQGIDGSIVFESLKLDSQAVKDLKKKTNAIPRAKAKAGVLKEPLPVSLTLILRELTIQGKTKEAEIVLIYLVLAFYWSIQFRQFKFEPAESVVTYTLNNASNRFYFKSSGTLLKALAITAEVNHGTSMKHLISADDDDIITYIMNLRTRVSSLIVRFANTLYQNLESKEYLNTVRDDNDSDGGSYYETKNLSGLIDNIGDRVTLDFFRYPINPKLVRLASKLSGGLAESKLKPILDDIKLKEKRENILDFFKGIILVYLQDGEDPADSIGSTKFLSKSLTIFNYGNTTNRDLLRIRGILEDLLNRYSDTYLHSNRKATKNAYKKGIYSYFLLHVTNSLNTK